MKTRILYTVLENGDITYAIIRFDDNTLRPVCIDVLTTKSFTAQKMDKYYVKANDIVYIVDELLYLNPKTFHGYLTYYTYHLTNFNQELCVVIP